MKETEDNLAQPNLEALLPAFKAQRSFAKAAATTDMAVVLSRHRHYRHLVVTLISAASTKQGKLKNPFQVLEPLDLVWQAVKAEEIKFFSGISKFRNHYQDVSLAADLSALKAIVANPLKLPFFVHDEQASTAINANSVQAVAVSLLKPVFEIDVDERDDTFSITGKLLLANKAYALASVALCYQYFIRLKQQLYLVHDPYFLSLFDFFRQNRNELVLTRSAYEDFQSNILAVLEEKVKINYAYLKTATSKQLKEQGFDLENEQLIYLSESEDFVLLTPVIRYGALEIPVISQKQIRSKDKRGQFFTLQRNAEKELQLITDIAKMHPYFEEQANEFSDQRHADCFYLHRKHFLEPEWFLKAFEAWRSKGIAILGFNELKDNKFNAYPAEINIQVISGMDWFETAIKTKFNQQLVSLKYLHKAIRNKNRFIPLDDGTIGILPEEWLKKFESYFALAEINEEVLRTPNIAYTAIEELYEETFLDEKAKARIQQYRSKLANFDQIEPVPVPSSLKATLRGYQQQGLNWLNFLDTYNFGGCLADDMGLGKTLQILAFILTQRDKAAQNTNLVVVPASLVFNWQEEIKKFAPDLKFTTIYGVHRDKQVESLAPYEVVLTSYGTLMTDVKWLKEYRFNYIFLDESQAIKNVDSQRYKAVRSLQSRNKIVITGTPIENNTFDLYGQLSFACPGLLGNREQFKQLYAVPIDQFKERRRAEELQRRIHPFILRRTKVQVAQELPDKTEMTIYCEMGRQQREIYESCRNEIREYLMGHSQDELLKSSMHVLQGITKLRQICNSPALLDKDRYYGNISAKMEVLLEQIEAKLPYHKILVFSQFVGMLNLVKAELDTRQIKYSYLSGQTKDRGAEVNAFQQDESRRVFLISLKAGGVGLNLTEADYVYLIDPWWNPAVEQQAIDRTYRIGQHKNVMAIRLICPDTVEEKIRNLQEHKKELVKGIIHTDTTLFKSLNKQELLDLI